MFKSIKEPRDGILQAVSVALGFALIENFIYANKYGITVLIVRSFLTTIGHMTYSVIWGFGWAANVYTSNGKNKSPDRHAIVPLLIFAALFHGIYNSFLKIGYPLLALMIDLLTISLFFLIYRYVKDNSPYKKYNLAEYRKAIPSIEMGLRKYPDSYILNKRLGIFNIYVRKYNKAEKYLKKAKKINTHNAGARFYYGVSKYLNGETVKGISQMNGALMSLTVNSRKNIVTSLDKIITEKSEKIELLEQFNRDRIIFEKKGINPKPYSSTVNRNKALTKSIEDWEYFQRNGERAATGGADFYSRKKERNRIRARKQTRNRGSSTGNIDKRGTWERIVKERPGPVILKPYYLKKGESVVRIDSKK